MLPRYRNEECGVAIWFSPIATTQIVAICLEGSATSSVLSQRHLSRRLRIATRSVSWLYAQWISQQKINHRHMLIIKCNDTSTIEINATYILALVALEHHSLTVTKFAAIEASILIRQGDHLVSRPSAVVPCF